MTETPYPLNLLSPGGGAGAPPDWGRDPLLVLKEKTNGDFQKTAIISQGIKSIIHSESGRLTFQQLEALECIALKIARILSGNPFEKDHWNDIAGYAHLGAELCPGEKK
jgi:hypothetical protein